MGTAEMVGEIALLALQELPPHDLTLTWTAAVDTRGLACVRVRLPDGPAEYLVCIEWSSDVSGSIDRFKALFSSLIAGERLQ